MIFLTETKCNIHFIYVRFNCKRKQVGVKKWEHWADFIYGWSLTLYMRALIKLKWDQSSDRLAEINIPTHSYYRKEKVLKNIKVYIIKE